MVIPWARKKVAMVTNAEKQAIRLRRMPMFFEHPRNGKEIKDFCHFEDARKTMAIKDCLFFGTATCN